MREWRKTHPLTPEQKVKDTCRSYSCILEKRGNIQRQPCQVCGERAERHHPDYSDPWNVVWVCRKCHLDMHEAARREQRFDGVLRALNRLKQTMKA